MEGRAKIEELLLDGLERISDPAERRMFLDWACRGEGKMRERVERLLSVSQRAEEFFSFQPFETSMEIEKPSASEQAREEEIGLRIGNYRLIRRLGEGGCGVVYLAEQESPVKRQVALKLIRVGLNQEEVIARFNAERQALAMMDHPGIARVFDAGATATGHPYFVMQWVTGEKITDFCDQHRLTISQRLELFIKVCQAVQHAHQKGVIHRDLKPSNVLAAFHDNVPVPKVIDFGIAKATGGNLAESEPEAKEEYVLGTPNYMSPEQGVRGGADVDTRSDIFSLGVLLCELLTGRTPFGASDNRRVKTTELRRSLAVRQAESLSAVIARFSPDELAVVAEKRGSDPKRMVRRLRGDLEAIVAKCLMRDPKDRYGTASGLAADVARHLRDEPVSALPPKRRYQLVKLVRRNKLVFLSGAVVFFALAAGFGASTWLFFREMEARCEQARLRGEADAARSAESRLRTSAEARELSAQAAVQISYGNLEKADRLLSSIPEGLTPSSLEAADAYRIIGDWHRLAGRWPQAAQRYTSLAEALTSVDSADTDNVSRNLLPAAAAVCESGDWERYERVRRIAIERFSGTEHPVVAEQIVKAGLLRPADEAMMEKLRPFVAVLENRLAQPELNKNRHMSAWSCFSLALWSYRRGDFILADEWANESLAYESQNSVRVASVRIILAMSAYRSGRMEDARNLLAQANDPVRRKLSEPPSEWDAREEFWFDWVNAHTLLDEARELILK